MTAQQIVDFMNHLEHPLKKEIEAVRSIILGANPQLEEQIKWNAPSFGFNGQDRITFNLHGKGFFRLVFHCGAKVKDNKGKGHLIEDTTGLLEWAAPDRAIVKLTDMNDVEAKRQKLAHLVAKWIEAAG